jgi:integrase
MASKALTQVGVEKMKPSDSRREIPDGLLAGLYLVVQPSGHKSWAVRTRINGRPVKATLGSFPAVSLKDARDFGRAAILKAKNGISVTEERREQQRKNEAARGSTFKAVAEEFLKRDGKELRSVDSRRKTLERLVYPPLGKRPIDEIRRTDIVRLLDKIEDESGPVMADRTPAYVRRILNWHASRSDDYRSPIVRGMARTKSKERERDRTLSDDELRAVWRAAGREEAGAFGKLVRYILLTTARRNEAAKVRREEVEGTDWTLPGARNKTGLDLIRPLSKAAVDLLASIDEVQGCPYYFSNDAVRAIGGFGKAKAAFETAVLKELREGDPEAKALPNWTLHDLRRTGRSLMSRAGVPTDHTERCLGHVIGGVRGVYDKYEYHREKQLAFKKLAALIERIVNPVDNVAVIRR